MYQVGERALTDGIVGFRSRTHVPRINNIINNRFEFHIPNQNNNKLLSSHNIDEYHQTGLTYLDFIYFYLSDINKMNKMSLRYWFHCCDFDGNGMIPLSLCERIYNKNQYERFLIAYKDTNGRVDVLPSNSMMEYLINKLNPIHNNLLIIDDFINNIHQLLDSGHFFNALCNVSQYVRHEERSNDERKVRRNDFINKGLNDWDKYAAKAYRDYASYSLKPNSKVK